MFRIHFLLIEILPSALLLMLPVLWIKHRHDRLTFAGYYVFSVYLAAVYALAGLPTVLFFRFDPSFALVPFGGMLDDLKNSILNVLLFVPLGFLLPLLWNRYRSLTRTMLFGLGMTLAIEFLQIFTYRATDVNDIITNTAGTFLGYLMTRALVRKVQVHSNGGDICFLLGMVFAVMFFIQPFLSAVIWAILP